MDSLMKMTGLFGYPVGHSMSPSMHNAAFEKLGLPYRYAAFSIHPNELHDAVKGIRALGFRGVNVTIPHKVQIIQYLDDLTEEASRIGAVNTIINDGGKLVGHNTDGQGFICSLAEEWNTSIAGKTVVLLGAGGAARAVAVTLAIHGVEKIIIANRTLEKAEKLADHISTWVPSEALTLSSLDRATFEGVDLLVNTTSVGMSPDFQKMPIPAELLHPGLMVCDLIYNPLKTKLLVEAQKAGAKTHQGFGMFVHQGALAFELWTEQKAPVDLMKKVVLDRLLS